MVPGYCPFCGAIVNPAIASVRLDKDSNPLTGRALWPLKWSLLSILIGMALLMTASVIVPLIIIFVMVAQDPSLLSGDINAMEDLVYTLLLNPVATALLSITEFVLVIPPFAILRKYRRSTKERFMLLGWRPYFGDAGGGRGWKRLSRDLAWGLLIALGLVGFQFLIVILNDALWTPLIPGGNNGLGNVDVAITPRDPFQLVLLVASMMLVIGPTEEILFRGFSQQGLEARLDPKNALVISALLFTLVHVITGIISPSSLPFMFFPYFCLSLLLCGIYWRTKDLNLMIFIHGIYDSLLVLYSYFFVEMERVGMEAMADVLIYASFAAFAVLGIYVIVLWITRRRQRIYASIVVHEK